MSRPTPKPNSGEAVSDVAAAGNSFESQADWLQKNNVNKSDRIRLQKLSHVRYQHPDLDEISTFLAGTESPGHRLILVM